MEPAGEKSDARTAAIRAFHQARDAGDAGRMAEAALALCSQPKNQLSGRVAYSQALLAELQLRPKSR